MKGMFQSFHLSLTAKIVAICLLNTLVFAVIAGIMIFSFGNIESRTNTIITRDVNRIIQNGQLVRDLSGVVMKTNLLLSTFYGHEDAFEKERIRIVSATDALLAREMDNVERDILNDFRSSLFQVMQQCERMNELYGRVIAVDRSLEGLLNQLEDFISGRIVELVLAGDDALTYEQIGVLIPSYREALLKVMISFTNLQPIHESARDVVNSTKLLETLQLRIRTLLASDSTVAFYGQELLSGITLYRQGALEFKDKRNELLTRITSLSETEEHILAVLKKTDDDSVNAAQLMRDEITTITKASVRSVFMLSVVVALMFGLFTYVFLLWHIRRPMESIRKGIELVRNGDLQTRITLGRKDEWKIIENALNQMTEDLFHSYHDLQNKNEELARAHGEMAENMRVLREEIGQRERAEHEAEKLQHQLQHAQKMEAIGTLAGGVAHDFNNLLQGIQGYCEILLLTQDGEHVKELQEMLRATKRGGELTRQLLTFSRKMESNLCPVDLNKVIHGMQSLLERTIPKMINVRFNLKGSFMYVNGDASQLEQVLMNLAVNARDAMPDGGQLTIGTEDVVLDQNNTRILPEVVPGPYVLLTVSDTGEGMDKDTQTRIFDPFFTTKDIGKGTGLGLAIIYGIIKNHEGYVICESEPKEGTIFNIYLPAISHQKNDPPVGEEEEMPRGTETILLVDDEDFIREIGQRILTEFGYTVLTAVDAESALQLYEQEREGIDLVILDIIMPGMGGEQCLKKMIAEYSPVKIIIASGYSEKGSVAETVHHGAKAIINKPYNVGQMLRVVRQTLDTNT